MKNESKKMPFVLKFLAGAGVLLSISSWMCAAHAILDGTPPPALVLLFGIFAVQAAGLCGGLLKQSTIRRLPVPASKLLQLGASILAFGVFLIFSPGAASSLPEALGAFAAVLVGAWIQPRGYAEILTDPALLVALIGNAAAVVLYRLTEIYTGRNYSLDPLVLLFLIYLAIFAVVRNQSNIDSLMERRRHSLEHLPKRIRYYNILLTIGIVSLILLLYLFRDAVIRCLSFFGSVLVSVIAAAVNALNALFSLLLSGSEESGGMGGMPPVMGNSPPKSSGYNLMLFLFLAAVTILIVVYRKELWRFLREKAEKIADFVRKLLHRTYLGTMMESGESEYYSDQEEAIPTEEIARERAQSRRRRIRAWKQEYREFGRKPDGAEKYREGYRLLLNWIQLEEPAIRESDTVREVLEQCSAMFPEDEYLTATEGYDRVRYGEREPSEQEKNGLEVILSQIYHHA